MNSNTDFLIALEDLIDLMDKNWAAIDVPFCGLWTDGEWSYPEGAMDYFEIIYFIEGHTELFANGKKYAAKKGHLYFYDTLKSTSCKGTDFKMYYISFRTDDKQLKARLRLCFCILSECIQPDISESIINHFIELSTEYFSLRDYYRLIMKCHLLNILTKVYRRIDNNISGSSINTLTFRNERMVSDIIKYLNENYNHNIDLNSLSAIHHLNSRSLNIIFKRRTSYTVIKYLIHLRVEKAKRLLNFTDLSITEIAFEIGFCDSQYFCNMFKCLEGMPPSKYRKSKLTNL